MADNIRPLLVLSSGPQSRTLDRFSCLQEDMNVTILPAHRGNVTVVLDQRDYW